MDPYYLKYLKYKNKYIKLNDGLTQIGGIKKISFGSIKNTLKTIETKSYEIFKLNLTEEDKKTICSLNINIIESKPTKYNFYGNIDDFINNTNQDIDELVEFIKSISINSYENAIKISCIIKNILSLLERGYNKNYCWLTIRIVKNSNAFKIPRWHCDGNYFNKIKYPYPQTKFVMVLKGPGTLLIKPNYKVKEIYNNYLEFAYKSKFETIEDRELLDKKLKEVGAVQIQLKNDEGLIFLAGHPNCTIHSEPDIIEPRMFLSIVMADKENINDWKCKNHKK